MENDNIIEEKEETKRIGIVCCLIVLLFILAASYNLIYNNLYNLTRYESYPISNEVINEEPTEESNQLKNE